MQANASFDLSNLPELRRLELRTRRVIDTDLMGHYRSAFRGSGLIFSDLREYQPGDEVRNIHWKVTARTGKPFVKTFEEDRQLNVILAVDVSSSTGVGTNKTKHQKALEFTALVTMLSFKNQDNVGLCLFADDIEEYYPPKRKRTQFHTIMSHVMAERALTAATDLNSTLEHIAIHQRRNAIVFLISDFYCASFEHNLRNLSHRHDVIGVLVRDAIDAEIPEAGLVRVRDAETGGMRILDTRSQRVRSGLKTLQAKRTEQLRLQFRRVGADFIAIDNNPLRPLAELMQRRTRRH